MTNTTHPDTVLLNTLVHKLVAMASDWKGRYGKTGNYCDDYFEDMMKDRICEMLADELCEELNIVAAARNPVVHAEDDTLIPGTDVKKPRLEMIDKVNGNAYSILAVVTKALRKAKVGPDVINSFQDEATKGDYDNLLRVASRYVDIV